MKLTIKPVEVADIGPVLVMSRSLRDEVHMHHPIMDEDELQKKMFYMLANRKSPDDIFLIAYNGKTPVGFLVGYVHEHPYGKPKKVGVFQELYVTKAKRGKIVALNLVKSAFDLMKKRGAQRVESAGAYGGPALRWQRLGLHPYLVYAYAEMSEMEQILNKSNKVLGNR